MRYLFKKKKKEKASCLLGWALDLLHYRWASWSFVIRGFVTDNTSWPCLISKKTEPTSHTLDGGYWAFMYSSPEEVRCWDSEVLWMTTRCDPTGACLHSLSSQATIKKVKQPERNIPKREVFSTNQTTPSTTGSKADSRSKLKGWKLF